MIGRKLDDRQSGKSCVCIRCVPSLQLSRTANEWKMTAENLQAQLKSSEEQQRTVEVSVCV